MNLNLTGKRALVCGSTQGIGKACAFALADLGAHVSLFARDAGKLEDVRSGLSREAEQRHAVVAADFSQPH